MDALLRLAGLGLTHGDLSAYNVLVHEGRLVLIDLPQAVDVLANPGGLGYLERDVHNISYWFAARGLGAPVARVLSRHVVPNALPPMLVKGTLDIGNAIILTAALSFIGLGAVPPEPEWGAMIAAGRAKFEYWWVATFPGLAILSVVLGFNFLGDGLQDWLNPRLRRD